MIVLLSFKQGNRRTVRSVHFVKHFIVHDGSVFFFTLSCLNSSKKNNKNNGKKNIVKKNIKVKNKPIQHQTNINTSETNQQPHNNNNLTKQNQQQSPASRRHHCENKRK